MTMNELNYLREMWILIDKDEEALSHFALSHYGLFRIQPYLDLFLHEDSSFHITQVLQLYELDKQIRAIMGELIQMIEIDFKAKLVRNTLTIPWDQETLPKKMFTKTEYWEIDRILSEAIRNYMKDANDVRDRKNTKFHDIVSVASFWDMYKIFNALNFNLKSDIIEEYQLEGKSVERVLTWLRAIRKMRNIWAHHDICIRNPQRLFNISLQPWIDGKRGVFNYLQVFFFLAGKIDPWSRDILRNQSIKIIKEWAQKFPFLLRIIGAPNDWIEKLEIID